MIPMAAVGVLCAQQGPIRQEIESEVRARIAGAVAGAPGANTFEFVVSEMVSGPAVKGQPYSAEAVTETVQVLGDGNRIVRKSSSMIYRDSEGRERRDQTLGGGFQSVSISDPVAKVNWSLNPEKKTAVKMPRAEMRVLRAGPEGSKESSITHAQSTVIEMKREGEKDVLILNSPAAPGNAFPPLLGTMAGSNAVWFERHTLDSKNMKNESLGRQTIEGVMVEGTRTTFTIPAGEIGNERPIEIVSERWYSPELQVVVMTRRSDPRTGETTYKLTRVNRTEPLKSLFEVPPDYTVTEPPARFRALDGEMREKLEKDLRQGLKLERREIF
jgi:hypothetical protein